MQARDDALHQMMRLLDFKRDALWQDAHSDLIAPPFTHTDRETALATATRASSDATGPPGSATARALRQRVVAREDRCIRRQALDLQRLADVEQRMRLREAEAARRRWFVLGRLLDQAAGDDPRWAQVLELLLARGPLTPAERRALDQGDHPAAHKRRG